MSLISLLFALIAEKHLSSSTWQFNTFYKVYQSTFAKSKLLNSHYGSALFTALFVLIPTVIVYGLFSLVDSDLLYLILSTVVLIVCFGCVKTRDSYKSYLLAAFKGEPTTCEMHHWQLQQDKNQPEMHFGQLLVWLNYRYYIAIMIFFVLFGPTGAVFYRLITSVSETKDCDSCEVKDNEALEKEQSVEDEAENFNHLTDACYAQKWLFGFDWLLVRVVSFGYMLVGHFSKAMPIWLEGLFDFTKAPYKLLTNVAEKSEDFMVDQDDCTAEPCLLVRLAKRTLLLCLSVVSILILTGIIS